MKIHFHGAAGDVTGAAFQLTTERASVLVDCGLYQGSRQTVAQNRKIPKLARRHVDAVVLSHAHLDHIGRLPLLTKAGYDGPDLRHAATFDLAALILRDSPSACRTATRAREPAPTRAGLQPKLEPPCYDGKDVGACGNLHRPVAYDRRPRSRPASVPDGRRGPHPRLGQRRNDGRGGRPQADGRRLLRRPGPRGAPLLRPHAVRARRHVFMESTYGDRDHRSLEETAIEGREDRREGDRGEAKILVPAFAIGRTQLLLYLLAGAFQRKTLPPFPVFIDSPMAIEATKLYRKHAELFDEEALAMHKSGELRDNLDTVQFCPTANDSRASQRRQGPVPDHGRGRHVHRRTHPAPLSLQPGPAGDTRCCSSAIQSHGSLGRMLVDGRSRHDLRRDDPGPGSVHTFGGLSGHAGQSDLLHWFGSLAPSRPHVFLTHGEDRGRSRSRSMIAGTLQDQCRLPRAGRND